MRFCLSLSALTKESATYRNGYHRQRLLSFLPGQSSVFSFSNNSLSVNKGLSWALSFPAAKPTPPQSLPACSSTTVHGRHDTFLLHVRCIGKVLKSPSQTERFNLIPQYKKGGLEGWWQIQSWSMGKDILGNLSWKTPKDLCFPQLFYSASPSLPPCLP